MSKENYEFGQQRLYSSMTVLTVPFGSTAALVPASPNRVGVRFSAPPTNRVTVADHDDVTLDSGYNIYPATSAGLELCAAIQGSITTKPLYGTAAVATQTICVVETFLVPEGSKRGYGG